MQAKYWRVLSHVCSTTLSGSNCGKIWTTMNWAIYDGDVPNMRALRSILGWRTLHGGGIRARGAWRRTRLTLRDGSTKCGFHNRVQRDTPMSKWAGEGDDWIMLTAQGLLRKEDVTVSLLATTRQAAAKRTENGGSAKTKQPRDLHPLVLESSEEDRKLMLAIRGDSKTIGQCQTEDEAKYHRKCPESSAGMVGPWVASTTTCGRLVGSHLS